MSWIHVQQLCFLSTFRSCSNMEVQVEKVGDAWFQLAAREGHEESCTTATHCKVKGASTGGVLDHDVSATHPGRQTVMASK